MIYTSIYIKTKNIVYPIILHICINFFGSFVSSLLLNYSGYMELMESIAEVDSNPLMLPKVIRTVLGDSQKVAFYDHYRNENGKVPVDVIGAAFVEILSANNQGKN